VAAARATSLGNAGTLLDLPRVGDTWTYDVYDRGRKIDALTVSITGVSSEGKVTEKLNRAKYPSFSASRTFEPEFNPQAFQEVATPGGLFLAEFSPYVSPDPSLIGKRWEDLTWRPGQGAAELSMELEIVGSEKIRVPAGEFMAIKVEGTIKGCWYQSNCQLVFWYAPQVKRTVRLIRKLLSKQRGYREEEDIFELASYKLKE
jgi:hypothetical protein